jgi:hypothetical protein
LGEEEAHEELIWETTRRNVEELQRASEDMRPNKDQMTNGGRLRGSGRKRRLAKSKVPCEQTRRRTMCKANICKVCGYGPCEVTKIPLKFFAQCENVMAGVVKCNCYGPIKRI